jgi:3-isopropylmalate/(R)-2-methylmalate dehydratase large subunit
MTIVCGDSHTSTHGAFGALAFGIGTSEVEHVLATQTLPQSKPKTFRIAVEGKLPTGVTAKDIILAIIGQIGTDGATGCVIEYAGSAIRALSMEGRMTVCNMSIEGGARAGMIAPDETTFAYLKGRRFRPKGKSGTQAVAEWSKLPTDPGAKFDRELVIDAATLVPYVTWGTSPGMVAPITGHPCPIPPPRPNEQERKGLERALEYMNLKAGTPLEESRSTASSSAPAPTAALKICAPPPHRRRLQGLHARKRDGRSRLAGVKAQAEAEGLDKVFAKPASTGASPAAPCAWA